jgi:hypothetical protein
VEIIPDAGITAGNVFTYAEAGFGTDSRGLKDDWGPEMICPDIREVLTFRPAVRVKFGWDFLSALRRAQWH